MIKAVDINLRIFFNKKRNFNYIDWTKKKKMLLARLPRYVLSLNPIHKRTIIACGAYSIASTCL